jgi:hypothetical protein
VAVQTYNFPPDQNFEVTMWPLDAEQVDVILVATINSGEGGSLAATFPIPRALYGAYRIAIRLQSATGNFVAENWFYNVPPTMTPSVTPTHTPEPPPLVEDCLPFDTSNVALHESNGNWWIVNGSALMLYFGTNEAEAREALNIIQHYGMNNQCFVGRPDPSLEYWLVNGVSPAGSYPGEDCIGYNLSNIEVVNIDGRWKIVEGSHWILDFAGMEDEARTSYQVLQSYGFNYICFVGRPDASMTYFRR